MFLLVVEWTVRRHAATLDAYNIDNVENKFTRLAAANPPPKILLLGSSRTHLGLSPEVFERATGCPTFNLGISASSLPEWQSVARRALRQIDPDLIVIGVNARALRSDVLPILAACQLFDFTDLVDYSLRYEWSNEVIDYYMSYQVMGRLALWRESDRMRMWLNETVLHPVVPKHAQLARERRELKERDLPADGFDHPWRISDSRRTLPELLDAWGADYLRPPPVPAYSEDDEAVRQFDDLLAELNATGKRVIVCYLPNSPRTEDVWRGREPMLIETIAAIADRHGVPFLDASMEALPRTDADFVDDTHVALPLAERISERAARHVIRSGLIEIPGPHLAGRLTEDETGE